MHFFISFILGDEVREHGEEGRKFPRRVSENCVPLDHALVSVIALLNLVDLQSAAALHTYSQRWYISLFGSYVKDIPDEDDGRNSCDRTVFVPSSMR